MSERKKVGRERVRRGEVRVGAREVAAAVTREVGVESDPPLLTPPGPQSTRKRDREFPYQRMALGAVQVARAVATD